MRTILRDYRDQRDWVRPWREPPGIMCCCAGVTKKLYMFGGEEANATVHNYAYTYVAGWNAVTAVPSNTAAAICPSSSGAGNLMGGTPTGSGLGTTNNRQYTPDVWTTKAVLLQTRKSAGACTVSGIEYLVAGIAAGAASGRNDAYDTVGDSWSNKMALPTAGFKPQVTTLQGVPYALGLNVGGVGTNHNYQYSVGGDSWATKMNLPSAVGSGGVWELNSKGYVFGGTNASAGQSTATQQYDPGGDSWTAKATMTNWTGDNAFATVDNATGYSFCGDNPSGSGVWAGTLTYVQASDTWGTGVSFTQQAINNSCGAAI